MRKVVRDSVRPIIANVEEDQNMDRADQTSFDSYFDMVEFERQQQEQVPLFPSAPSETYAPAHFGAVGETSFTQ